MASNKKNQKTANPELEDEVIEGQEQANDEAPEGDEQNAEAGAQDEVTGTPDETEEAGASHKVTVKLDSSEVIKAIHHHVASMGDLHARIEKLARAIAIHGGHDRVHALNQVELLTGRLKMTLPAAITAVEDAELKTALETLLGLL